MNEKDLNIQLKEIGKKLDILTEEIYAQKERRRFADDLYADLTKISSSVINSSGKTLEDLGQFASMDDVIYLIKKVLLNIKNLTGLLDAIENIMDFYESFMPIAKEMFSTLQTRLLEIENLGYFDLIIALKDRINDLMRNTKKEELYALADNIIAFLKAAKDTHLDFSRSEKSLFHLMQDINSREMKGVIDTILQFVSNFDKERKALSK